MRAPINLVTALRAARAGCQADCFAYHAAWRPARRLGVKSQPAWHHTFYQHTLTGRWPASVPLRVLILGASDEAMLAQVHQLTRGHPIHVHLVDRCATPLTLAGRYATGHHRLDLTTQQADVEHLHLGGERYDLIISDGLLSLLGHNSDQLIGRVARLLTPGGLLAYTTRLTHPGHRLEYDRLGRALQTLACLCWPASPAERLRLAARAWSTAVRVSPFTDEHAVRAAFTPHFATVTLHATPSAASLALRLHPLTLSGRGSRRVGVAATNPTPTRATGVSA